MLYFTQQTKGNKMFNTNLINKSSLVLLTATILIGCGGASTNPLGDSITKSEVIEISVSQQELLNAINKARSIARDCYPNDSNRGQMEATHPLTWNENLYASALEHSTDLANSDTFSHAGSGTEHDITGNGKASEFFERILANGYSNYYTVGENIAGGQKDLEEVMKAWLNSPGHCVNIMKESYDEVGIAIVSNDDSTYGIYWTQNFGSKRK